MSIVTSKPPGGSRTRSDRRRGSRRDGGSARLRQRRVVGPRTLEELVVATIEDLGSRGVARCPVCATEQLAAEGCRACGSTLA